MKQIEFNRKQYQLPESWNEVKYHQYKDIVKLDRLELGKLEKTGRMVSILSGIEYRFIQQSEPKLVMMILKELNFLDEEIKPLTISSFTFNNQTFIVNTLEKSTFNEFVHYEKIEDDFAANPEDGIPFKLAALCRLEGEKVDEVDYVERAKLFEELDTETVIGISDFFLLKKKQLERDSQLFSNLHQIKENLKIQLQKISTKNTDGSVQLTFWQRIYLKLILYLI